MPPITFDYEIKLTSEEEAKKLIKDLTPNEKANLLKALQGDKEDETSHSQFQMEVLVLDLLKKENMTETDKKNMQTVVDFLKEGDMYTIENLKEINNAVSYGVDFIKAGPTKFSREKLVPQVQFKAEANEYDVFESDKEGVFKTKYNGQDEYYLTQDAYIEEAKNQGKKAIKDDHIRKALQSLPGEFADNNWYNGANILGNILNMSMSGYVDADGGWWDRDNGGYLGSASPVDTDNTRAFIFYKDEGGLDNNYSRRNARPCLFVVE